MWTQLSIKHRLLLLASTPMLVVLSLLSSIAWEAQTNLTNLNNTIILTKYGEVIGSLVHEMQKERGTSAGYLSSKSDAFKDKLISQRQLSDMQMKNFRDFVSSSEVSSLDSSLAANITSITTTLNEVTKLRNRIIDQQIEMGDALAFYTNLNKTLLDQIVLISKLSSEPRISVFASAYYSFTQAKERAGIERAVVSAVFSKKERGTPLSTKALSLSVQQKSFISLFQQYASEESRSFYEEKMAEPIVRKIDEWRALITDNTMSMDVAAETWFEGATQRINLMKQIEDALAKELIAIAEEEVKAAQSLLNLCIMVSLGIIVFCFLFSFAVTRSILRPIKAIKSGLLKIQQDRDLTCRVEVIGKDELSASSAALNELLTQFNNIMSSFSSMVSQVSSASVQVSSSMKQVEDMSFQHRTETDSVTVAMNEMVTTIQDIARRATETANRSTDAHQVCKQGSETGLTSRDEMQSISEEVEGIVNKVEQLADSTQSIGDILDVIRGIAEQTNLLALNAAIESARAGEQGRGFAVVADEVRTLAGRTQSSTEEIRGNIEILQKGASEAANSMCQFSEKTLQCVDYFKEIVEVLSGIATSVETVDDLSGQIATSSEEQGAVAENINENIIKINTFAEDISHQAKESSQAMTLLIENTEKLQHQIEQFKIA